MNNTSPPPKGLIRRFFREQVRPYFGLQAQIAFCLVVSVILGLIDPLILKAIIDRALGDGGAPPAGPPSPASPPPPTE